MLALGAQSHQIVSERYPEEALLTNILQHLSNVEGAEAAIKAMEWMDDLKASHEAFKAVYIQRGVSMRSKRQSKQWADEQGSVGK